MRLVDGLRFAVGTLTVFPVRVERVDRAVAGRAMALAPGVGLVLGLAAGLPLLLPLPPLLGAALTLGLLALLTRGLHLDGLADLADGLGSAKPAPQALDIMKKSDIGPFGVITLVFMLLVQVAALTSAGYAALVTACVTGRLALTWACREGVPAARPDGLGAMVAGTVRRSAALLTTLAALLAVAVLGLLTTPGSGIWAAPAPAAHQQDEKPDERWTTLSPPSCYGTGGELIDIPCPRLTEPGLRYETPEPAHVVAIFATESPGSGASLSGIVAAPLALLAGLVTALALLRRARSRLGGITGDVLGALVETATTASLVVAVVLA